MDIFKKFQLECPTFKKTINGYTREGNISNYFIQLENAIQISDMEVILFLLESITKWYKNNQSKIQSNDYVLNKEDHIENEKKLNDYLIKLAKYKIDVKKEVESEFGYTTKKFFISHSSKDSNVCCAFVTLLENLGVPESDILYTSSDRHGVPGDEDIFEYLIHYLRNGIFIFYMLSDNYYNSPYCLNEMGAAWVVKNDYSLMLLPNLNGKIEGVVNSNKKGYDIASKYKLNEIRDKILDIYEIEISENRWDQLRTDFLTKVNESQ